MVRKAEKVETTSREEAEGKSSGTKPLSPKVDREKFFAEYGKSDPGLKRGNKIFDSRETKGEASVQAAMKSDNEWRDQLPSSFRETTRTEPCKDTDAMIQLSTLSEKKSTPNGERQNVEVKLREKPEDAVASSDSQHRHSQPFETSKGWRSMEMLRSFSVSDAVMVDPMERAKEDYLSLMMAQPKLSLERINRQYFDLDSDHKRMEEWHKKQEQLRKVR